MNVKKLLQFLTTLDRRNKIIFCQYILFTMFLRLTGKRLKEKTRISLNEINYEISIGKGELNTIYHTNILQDYYQLDDFKPKTSSVCIDVGANIGSTALLWNRTISNGSIYAIEPQPDTYKSLLRNIHINAAMKTISPRQLAIGSTNGEMTLIITDGGTMAMRPGNYEGPVNEIQVRTMTLDSFAEMEGIEHIDLLKVDIEGYEVDALLGAKRILNRTDRLVIEFHSDELYRQCKEILSENGFTIEKRNTLLFCTKSVTTGR